MPSFKLTDQQCKAARPRERAYKVFDGQGLHLWVSPKGAKVWRLQYRRDGKQQTLSLGPYPSIGLADARNRAALARSDVRTGVRPSSPEKRASGPDFASACATYWNGRADVSDGYRDNALAGLHRHLRTLAKRPIGAITRDELMVELAKVNARHPTVR